MLEGSEQNEIFFTPSTGTARFLVRGASQANQTAETPLVAKDAADAATDRMGAEGSRPAGPGRPDIAQALGARAATVNGTWRKAPLIFE